MLPWWPLLSLKPGTVRGTNRRPLSEAARHVIPPAGITRSEWPSVRKTCRRLGWDFDGWQDGAGMLILSQREDGEYAADTIVISIPRQVGKTYLIACIIFALCLMKPGLKVIWTAQVKDTALETFDQFFSMAQRPKVKPSIASTPRGKGDEAIIFRNGSSIEFGARDSGFGRGRTDVGVIVYDEGQHLSNEALENMGATQNVADNPLCFVMGTPPRPKDKGEYFSILRREALDGDSDGTLYIEMSADRGCDPMDRDQWRKANPSFPVRTSERAMLRLRKKLRNEDSWRREALGVWDDVAHRPAIAPELWKTLFDVAADGVPPDAFGVDESHQGAISIAASWVDGDHVHAEEVWAGSDAQTAIAWLADRSRRGRTIPIVIDNASPAKDLAPDLNALRLNVKLTTAGDMATACGLVVNKASAGTVSHAAQEPVTEALKGAKKRPIRDAGGWGWDRRDETTNIAPLVAWTLAVYGSAIKRRKTDKQRKVVVLT